MKSDEVIDKINQIISDGVFPDWEEVLLNAVALIVEQQEEIEALKQTAQSMMEGIVVSTSMFHPCESCQEFNCDFCKFKDRR